jgi:hypothetical protein
VLQAGGKRRREPDEVSATIRACPPNNTRAVDRPQRGRLSQRLVNVHVRS